MRYVAHSKPDALLYSLMIRACAGTGASQSSYSSEPERALDLWKEMIEDSRIEPTIGAYNAIILACARSKKFSSEAFRLAKEMLDAHRDAFGNPLMRPNHETFCALLVAAKTTGDLPRARWILAEMVGMTEREKHVPASQRSDARIDEAIMLHVFHAYASYNPPFRRGRVRVVEDSLNSVEEDKETRTVEQAEIGSFSTTPPQTAKEVVAESQVLFARILRDNGKGNATAEDVNLTSGLFSGVSLSPRLANAYLSVHYKHASLEEAQKLYDSIFSDLQLNRSLRTYAEALERCAFSAKRHEREIAKKFANSVWEEWNDVQKNLGQVYGSPARTVERAYAAMIRVSVM